MDNTHHHRDLTFGDFINHRIDRTNHNTDPPIKEMDFFPSPGNNKNNNNNDTNEGNLKKRQHDQDQDDTHRRRSITNDGSPTRVTHHHVNVRLRIFGFLNFCVTVIYLMLLKKLFLRLNYEYIYADRAEFNVFK